MTDLHRILARLQPEPDGEPTLSRRTATLTAINGDGTVQINLSGIDVRARALSGWNMTPGTVVQVLVERGDLLVLGEAITPGGGFVTNITQGVIDFAAADTLVCVPHGIPFTPDPAHFQLTARNDPGSTLHWWVDSADAVDLCIALDQAPGGDLGIAWRHIGGPLSYGCADNADIVHDGWAYHVFTTSGTFTPDVPGAFDLLMIGGGGGGGGGGTTGGTSGGGGGGGAGGVIMQLGYLIGGATSITVGTGGTGGTGSSVAPTAGADTVVDLLTAFGGGEGAYYVGGVGGDGGNGGSGGGGAVAPSTSRPPGTGTPGQGHDGGAGADPGVSRDDRSGGGGGGAGHAGTSGATINNPKGGDGVYLSEFDAPGLGSPQGWFGGGGGGGRVGAGLLPSDGGAGGGGRGSTINAQQNGVDGTGGGGGGARSQAFGPAYNGGDGGDGIVIIRHPVCTPS